MFRTTPMLDDCPARKTILKQCKTCSSTTNPVRTERPGPNSKSALKPLPWRQACLDFYSFTQGGWSLKRRKARKQAILNRPSDHPIASDAAKFDNFHTVLHACQRCEACEALWCDVCSRLYFLQVRPVVSQRTIGDPEWLVEKGFDGL